MGTSSFPSLASFHKVSIPLRMRQDIRKESMQHEMCFESNETFFSPRRPTFKCARDGGRVFNRRRVQLRVFSAAALARVTHVSLTAPQRSLLTPRSRNKELWDGLKDNESEQLLVQAWIMGRITYHRGI